MLRLLSVLVDGIFRFYVEQHINLALNFQPFFMGYPPLPFIHGLPGADHYNFPRCIDVFEGSLRIYSRVDSLPEIAIF